MTREQIALLNAEQRNDTVMVKGTGNVGGYTVPTSFLPKIIEKLEQNSPIYALANRIDTSSGEDLQVPQVTAHASASWIAENGGAFDSVSDTFAQVTMKSYLVAELAKLSVQLLADNAVDLEAYLARSIGRAVGTKLSVGASNATTTPQGLLASATAGITLTTGNTTTLSVDNLIDLVHSVTPPYRNAPGSCFILNDATIGYARKLKFSIGSDAVSYAWQPSNQAGQPDKLLGFDVYADPNVAVMAADAITVGFGNVDLAYMVRQAGGFSLRRLDERFADTFLVGFLGYMRIDGKLVDSNAFKTLVQSHT
jgi:HK97 family phage major capsid protein